MDENDDKPSDLGVLPALNFSEPIPLILGSVMLDSKLGHAEQTQGDGLVYGKFTGHGLFFTCFYNHLFGYGSIPINTIFRGMNIHLPAILMFTRGTRF